MNVPFWMTGKTTGRIVVAVLIALLIFWFWPSDIRAVEKNMRKMLAAVGKTGPESLPVSAARSLEAGSYLASNVLLRLGEPFPEHLRKSDAITMLQQARMRADRISVNRCGHNITQTSESEIVMDITLEGEASIQERTEQVIGSYRFTWGDSDGEWKLIKAEVNEVIRHPSGEIHPF